MQKYGVSMDQLGAHGQAAAHAAERHQARTLIYRDKVAVAALVPIADLNRLDPVQQGDPSADPLLALCGTCNNDAFADSMNELGNTVLFTRTQAAAGPSAQAAASPSAQAAASPSTMRGGSLGTPVAAATTSSKT